MMIFVSVSRFEAKGAPSAQYSSEIFFEPLLMRTSWQLESLLFPQCSQSAKAYQSFSMRSKHCTLLILS